MGLIGKSWCKGFNGFNRSAFTNDQAQSTTFAFTNEQAHSTRKIVNTLVLAISSRRRQVRGWVEPLCLDWGFSVGEKILGLHLAKGIGLASNA